MDSTTFFGTVASAALRIFFVEMISDIAKTGVEKFRVGRSVQAAVHKVGNGDIIKSGNLLLLTPQDA